MVKRIKTNEQEIKTIFWEFIKLDGTFSEKSLKLIKDFTHSNTLSTQELHELIYIALSSKTVDVSFWSILMLLKLYPTTTKW